MIIQFETTEKTTVQIANGLPANNWLETTYCYFRTRTNRTKGLRCPQDPECRLRNSTRGHGVP